MPENSPLKGVELVDCAKASAKSGLEVAAEQSGYGQDVDQFWENLQQACQNMGVHIEQLEDLITDQHTVKTSRGIEIAPDTQSDL
ncbi:MAG: hypothetical protein ACFBSC_02015 [Microcoleaceae cyanobacterium]